jgi:prepilin-type N-terminal cleavage/methylation domain-containing protein
MDWFRKRIALSREDGFTLTELLVASVIGTIVIMAAYMVLDRSIVLSSEVSDRADALQRGRLTLELMTRELRSQVCLGSATEPITEGKPNTASFYVDTGDGSTNVQQRRLSYQATATTLGGVAVPAGSLTEERYDGAGTYPDLTYSNYPSAPNQVRIIGRSLRPVKKKVAGVFVDQPVFSYWAWDDAPGADTGSMEQLTTPLSTTDVSRTVMVRMQFVSIPEKKVATNVHDQDTVELTGDAYVRTADPSQPKEGPRCL